jgi:hypothetical protein
MKTNPYRSHSVAAALAATFVTTVLIGTVVESLNPSRLLRSDENAAGNPTVALDRKADSAGSDQA